MNFKFSSSSPCSFILSWVHEFIFWSWLNIRQRKPIMNVGLASCRYLLVASLSSLLLKSQPVLRSMANPGVSPNLFASSVNLGTDYISTMSRFSSVPIFPHDCRHPPIGTTYRIIGEGNFWLPSELIPDCSSLFQCLHSLV